MQQLLDSIHFDLVSRAIPFADRVPVQLVYFMGLLVGGLLIIGWMSFIAIFWIWAERKVSAFIQARVGPNRVGPSGLLQSVADGIKLLTKEDIIPAAANRFLYELAPLLVFIGAFLPFVVTPFSQHLVIADMDLGLFYVMGFGALEVVGVLMAGWAPNSKWTLYGGMRLAAQMLSYEIPLGLGALTIVILSGSLNLTDIVLWQTQGFLIWDGFTFPGMGLFLGFLHWGIFRSPATFVGFFIFFIAGLAEAKRAPFDLPEAESELVSGFHTEYTGIRFSYFFLAEYSAMYVICLVATVLFLGGWFWPLPTIFATEEAPRIIATISDSLSHVSYEGLSLLAGLKLFLATALWDGPIATFKALTTWPSLKMFANESFGVINVVGKSFALMFVMLWIRWTLPRIRIDQVMHLCLKVLLPFGLACVIVAGIQGAMTISDDDSLMSRRMAERNGVVLAPLADAGEEPATETIEEDETGEEEEDTDEEE